ncbi:MAG: MmgE/PrpD family protein [Geminicoccaceae bacterium]
MQQPAQRLPTRGAERAIAETLAAFAAELRFEAIPAAVRERAKHLVLDAVGIALASSRHEFARCALAGLQALDDPGPVPVIGLGARLTARDAASLNGILVHGLDFDDTHLAGIVHATASAFPAALSAAVASGADGRELLTAYVLGVEVAARLGAVAKAGFHQVGFHPTSVCGVFSSALLAGRLMELSRSQLAMAQGIALSMASGSFEFLEDGAWTKRLHPGWAAASGITAAALAKGGFVGATAAYEGRFGLYRSYLGPLEERCDYSLATAGLGEVFEVMNVALKPYPACHFTHGCLDAAIALAREHRLEPGAITRAVAHVPEGVVKTVCEPLEGKRRPQNAYDAQFSIPYQVAAALLRGRFTLEELEPEAVGDPKIRALAARVDYAIDPDTTFPKHYSGEVVLELQGGRQLRRREPINRGAPDRPLGNHEIAEKFMANATTAVARERAEQIRSLVLGLDELAAAGELAEALGKARADRTP